MARVLGSRGPPCALAQREWPVPPSWGFDASIVVRRVGALRSGCLRGVGAFHVRAESGRADVAAGARHVDERSQEEGAADGEEDEQAQVRSEEHLALLPPEARFRVVAGPPRADRGQEEQREVDEDVAALQIGHQVQRAHRRHRYGHRASRHVRQ